MKLFFLILVCFVLSFVGFAAAQQVNPCTQVSVAKPPLTIIQPLLPQVVADVNNAANDANIALQYAQTTYPSDPTLQQLIQTPIDDLGPLIAVSIGPPAKPKESAK